MKKKQTRIEGKKMKINERKRQLITKTEPNSSISEQFKIIQTGIDFSGIDKSYQTILVTSPEPGTGKSTIAANLAIVYAQKGKKTLLIDGDMRKPTVHMTFNMSNHLGLSTNLTKALELSESCQRTDVKNLFILPSGIIPPNPAELLSSKRMEYLMTAIRKIFDIIIIDSPPITVVSDALILASQTDGVILVVRKKVTKKEKLKQATEQIDMVKAPIIGVVFNGESEKSDGNYYYEYK